MLYRLTRLLFHPASNDGGDGTGGNNTPPPDPTKAYEALLAKHNNDAGALASKLFDENFQLRQSRRDLEARVPAAGTVVLTVDQAKAWNAYQKLGDHKEIATQLDEGRQSTAKLKEITTTEALQQIGKEAGYSPSVFARLAKQDGLTPEKFEVTTVKGKDGKDHPAVFFKGEGDAKTPLADFVGSTWSEFAPALKPTTEPGKAPIGTPGVSSSRPPVAKVATETTDPGKATIEQQLQSSGLYSAF